LPFIKSRVRTSAHARRRRSATADTVPPLRAQFEDTELGIEAHGVFF
jgi:hypothetical protein